MAEFSAKAPTTTNSQHWIGGKGGNGNIKSKFFGVTLGFVQDCSIFLFRWKCPCFSPKSQLEIVPNLFSFRREPNLNRFQFIDLIYDIIHLTMNMNRMLVTSRSIFVTKNVSGISELFREILLFKKILLASQRKHIERR